MTLLQNETSVSQGQPDGTYETKLSLTKHKHKTKSHTTIFSNIYDKRIWAPDKKTPLSGSGSSIRYNRRYIHFLQQFIHEPKHNIQSIVDLGCGDWTFTQEIDFTGKTYLGVDCVPSVIQSNIKQFATPSIQFKQADFSTLDALQDGVTSEALTETDDYFVASFGIIQHHLLILKDVLQHWSDQDIITVLDFLTDTTTPQHSIKYILLVHGKRKQQNFNTQRSVDNYYHYSNLHYKAPPLNKYNIQHLFDYQYKQVGLISL